MSVRGIRGAITAKENNSAEIIRATDELLREMIAANGIEPDAIASAVFSVTADLNAEFPARAARKLGWKNVPLLCTNEIAVPGSLSKCIRILIHVNTEKKGSEVHHIYLGEAKKLRPDKGE